MATRTMIEFTCDAPDCTVVAYYPSGAYAKGMRWTHRAVRGHSQWYCPAHRRAPAPAENGASALRARVTPSPQNIMEPD